jgi:uncharacterized protein (TIGR04255 family)
MSASASWSILFDIAPKSQLDLTMEECASHQDPRHNADEDTLKRLGTNVADSEHLALPDFENPPVVETVLSAQFERISEMRAVHFGLFWRKVKDRFPETEERPPLTPVSERFLDPLAIGGRVRFEAIEVPELPRLWLHNPTHTELIQVQNDRFIKNWRKQAETDPYPRYEPVVKPAFERDFDEFKEFLAEETLGAIRVNQCEVTYVNHIVSGDGWDRLGEVERIFAFCSGTPSPYPGRPEDLTAHLRFPISHEASGPIGRLHVDIQPALRASDGRPMYVMNLTARGQLGEGIAFFDVGRQWIVKSFEQLTTQDMHRVWGKK